MGNTLRTVLTLAAITGMTTTGNAASPKLAGQEQLHQWVSTLTGFGSGNPVFTNVRQAGSKADDRAARWLADIFESLGLKDVRREPVPVKGWQPTEYGLTIHTGQDEEKLDAWPIFYARFLSAGSVTADMIYVGDSLKDQDVKGKIVVADLASPESLSYDNMKAAAYEVYDPDDTIAKGGRHRYWGFPNQDIYVAAAKAGAAAFVGIHLDKANDGRYYQNAGGVKSDPLGEYWNSLGQLAGLYVNSSTGDRLRRAAQAGSSATIVSKGTSPDTQTYNVMGFLPGQSDRIIQIHSHSDGGAVNDASGVAGVLAIADYYGRVKGAARRHTLRFLITGGHFISGAGQRGFLKAHGEADKERVKLNLTLEHVGKHYDLVDGKLADSGLSCARSMFTTNRDWFPLLSDAVHKSDLRRTFIMAHGSPSNGEGASWHWRTKLPSIYTITPVQYMQSSIDSIEKVDFESIEKSVRAYIQIIDTLDGKLE